MDEEQEGKAGQLADWTGYSDGGRALDIKVLWDEDRGAVLPITGMTASDADRRMYLRGSESR